MTKIETRTGSLQTETVMRIAHEDARRAYRDLSIYDVQAHLESDGWHVDYDLKDKRRDGGGPHYIIDADTGLIVYKVYEQ